MLSKESLMGMYKVLARSYEGNGTYRWKDTPYLAEAVSNGRTESIVGHVWATMEHWYHLRRLCTNLDSLVDSEEIYEILLNHDLGETIKGDTPLFTRVNGKADDKEIERAGIKEITDPLPSAQEEILKQFDEFEQDVEKIDRLEVLVAKWMDTLQGNHYALTFGNELQEYSGPINKILQIRFVAYSNRLISVLENKKQYEALSEVKLVARVHASQIKAAGIKFDAGELRV